MSSIYEEKDQRKIIILILPLKRVTLKIIETTLPLIVASSLLICQFNSTTEILRLISIFEGRVGGGRGWWVSGYVISVEVFAESTDCLSYSIPSINSPLTTWHYNPHIMELSMYKCWRVSSISVTVRAMRCERDSLEHPTVRTLRSLLMPNSNFTWLM